MKTNEEKKKAQRAACKRWYEAHRAVKTKVDMGTPLKLEIRMGDLEKKVDHVIYMLSTGSKVRFLAETPVSQPIYPETHLIMAPARALKALITPIDLVTGKMNNQAEITAKAVPLAQPVAEPMEPLPSLDRFAKSWTVFKVQSGLPKMAENFGEKKYNLEEVGAVAVRIRKSEEGGAIYKEAVAAEKAGEPDYRALNRQAYLHGLKELLDFELDE